MSQCFLVQYFLVNRDSLTKIKIKLSLSKILKIIVTVFYPLVIKF